MKKFVCAILASALMAVNAYAAPVDEARAKALAQRIIEKPVSISSPVSKGRRSKPANPALHLFNPNRSLEKASCQFLMTAIRKTALYMFGL